MPEIRVQDEQGNTHIFPDGSTPEMIAKAMGVKYNAPQANITPTPQGTISNQPTGLIPTLNNLEGDVRYGTGTTLLGRMLRGMGAKGVGDSGAANTVASLPLGAIRATKGAAELAPEMMGSNQPMQAKQGAKDFIGGLLQAGTIPGGFVAPEAAEAAANVIPSAKYAGKLFEQAKAAAGNLPVDISGAGNAALRAQELAENGGRMPTILNKFLRKSTAPDTGPMDYNTARDFYSNAGNQSIWQKLSTSPQMQRQISQFRGNLGDAIQATADQAGVGDVYRQALQEYHHAMVAQKVGKWAAGLAAAKVLHDLFGSDITGAVKGAASAAMP